MKPPIEFRPTLLLRASEDGGKQVKHRQARESVKPEKPAADSRERPAPFDRTAYQREYMRRYRARKAKK